MNSAPLRIAIVDYSLGNLYSVARACERTGLTPTITSSGSEILAADAVILPGVGAFGDAMQNLRELGLDAVLREVAFRGTPLYGICLGLQLLMNRSDEFGDHEGLGLIPGRVVHLGRPQGPAGTLKVPHVGWNRVFPAIHPGGADSWCDTPLRNVAAGTYFYFVHSYCVVPEAEAVTLSVTTYGDRQFCSAVKKSNICAFQYHPERSGEAGQQVYRNIATDLHTWHHREGKRHVA